MLFGQLNYMLRVQGTLVTTENPWILTQSQAGPIWVVQGLSVESPVSLLTLMFHASTAWDPPDYVFLGTRQCYLLQDEAPAPTTPGNMTQPISQHGLRLIKATSWTF